MSLLKKLKIACAGICLASALGLESRLYSGDKILPVQVSPGEIIVSDNDARSILVVDPITGNRRYISGGGNQDCVVDGQGKLLVCNYGAILKIDLNTGENEIISSNEKGTGPAITYPRGIAIEPSSSIVICQGIATSHGCLDCPLPELLRIAPTTGDRTLISSLNVGRGVGLDWPVSLAVTKDRTILVVDRNYNYLLGIHPQSGYRSIISGQGVGDGLEFSLLSAVHVNENGEVYVSTGDRGYIPGAIFKVDLLTGNRTLISGNNKGLGPPFPYDVNTLDNDNQGSLIAACGISLFRINPKTGDRELISNGRGSGPYFDYIAGVDVYPEYQQNPSIRLEEVVTSTCNPAFVRVFLTNYCPVEAFSFGLAYDPLVIKVVVCNPSGATALLNEGKGPEFWHYSLNPLSECNDGRAGVIVGMVGSLTNPAGSTIARHINQEIATLIYNTVPGVSEGRASSLDFVECLRPAKNTPLTPCIITCNSSSIKPVKISGRAYISENCFKRGDCNCDSYFDISDAVSILNYLYNESSVPKPPCCFDACDANDDGKLDVSDGIRMLGRLFIGSEELPDPYKNCGNDPVLDDLTCSSYDFCNNRVVDGGY